MKPKKNHLLVPFNITQMSLLVILPQFHLYVFITFLGYKLYHIFLIIIRLHPTHTTRAEFATNRDIPFYLSKVR